MNYFVFLKENKAFQNLNCIIPDFIRREADKTCCFKVFKKISVQKLKYEAVMLPKVGLIDHADNVMLVIWIFLHDVLQILSFLIGKFMIHFCVSCNFNRKNLFSWRFVILALDDLGKGALSKDFHDFVTISNMTTDFDFVISFNVIENWITLKFAIIKVFLSLLFLLVESANSIVLSIFQSL